MKQIKLVVVGSGGVGKSAITVQFVQGMFLDKYDPTIEDSYRKQLEVGGEQYMLEILDTAGQEELSAMRDVFMKTGEGFILVYSITNRQSFEDVDSFRKQITRAKDSEKIPLMLVGNKIDLEDQREVSTEEGKDVAAQWEDTMFLETSAKTKHNITEVFNGVVGIIESDSKPKAGNKKKKGKCALL